MKLNVAVIFGSETVEHEVSVISAHQAMNALDPEKYNVIPLYISKQRKFYYSELLRDIRNYTNLDDLTSRCEQVVLANVDNQVIIKPVKDSLFGKKVLGTIDIAVPVMHGTNGEDGSIQGYLEMLKLPYAGPDLYAAAVANGAKACGGSFMEFLPNGAERTKYEGPMSGMVFSQDGFVDYRDWQFDYGYVRFIYSRHMIQRAGIRFPAYARYQDPAFFARAMVAAGRFYALRRVTYRCRIHGGGVAWAAAGARRFKALCDGLRDVAEFAQANGLGELAALQRERVLHNFGELFFDDALCRMAKWRAWRLFKALGFRCRVRRWHVWLGIEPSSLVSYAVDRPSPIPGGADERLRRIYAGDLENFGKAYADGMAEIRRGGKDNV